MSKITEIYNAFDTLLSSTFSTRTELIDEINIEQNDIFNLRNGYAFRMISLDNNQEIYNNKGIVYIRQVEVTLTQEVYDLSTSVSDKKLQDKVLLEAQRTIVNAVYGNTDLNNSVSSLTFLSDGGITAVDAGDSKIRMIQSIFELKYTEFI